MSGVILESSVMHFIVIMVREAFFKPSWVLLGYSHQGFLDMLSRIG